jgi:predicted transcriptional regulator
VVYNGRRKKSLLATLPHLHVRAAARLFLSTRANMADHSDKVSYIQLTADIVSAYVSNNSVSSAEIPALISQVYSALMRISNGTAVAAPAGPLKPAVPIKRSITTEYLICLEDGKKFKSLKRHLRTQYEMTPDQYRAKWNLPAITRWSRPIMPRCVRSLLSKWGWANNGGAIIKRAGSYCYNWLVGR